jgi:hypothetical protein
MSDAASFLVTPDRGCYTRTGIRDGLERAASKGDQMIQDGERMEGEVWRGIDR